MNNKRRRIGRQRRRAAAIVEFAVVAPLLFTLLFGIIEYGYMFMVRQTVVHAAREAARIAVLQTTVEPYTEVTSRVTEVMAPTGIAGYTVTMTHATLANPMETVQVSVPVSKVSLMGDMFPHSGPLVGTCSMRKEGMPAPAGP